MAIKIGGVYASGFSCGCSSFVGESQKCADHINKKIFTGSCFCTGCSVRRAAFYGLLNILMFLGLFAGASFVVRYLRTGVVLPF